MVDSTTNDDDDDDDSIDDLPPPRAITKLTSFKTAANKVIVASMQTVVMLRKLLLRFSGETFKRSRIPSRHP